VIAVDFGLKHYPQRGRGNDQQAKEGDKERDATRA